MIAHRTMTQDDLRAVLEWAAQLGWNPGLDDAAAFFAADPGGFFAATDDDVPVAAISVVNHGADTAFLGLYICLEAYRGRGIGFDLWTHALAHAGDRTVGLDGVVEQQANYATSGFRLSHRTTRFTGHLLGHPSSGVRPADTADMPALIDLEGAASGWRKPDYLKAWLTATETRRTVVSDPGGFATVRRCRTGSKIGPLVAADAEDATRLLRHCAAIYGPDITVDVPQTSDILSGVCRDLGLRSGFETARMYRGAAPPMPRDLYAVTSLELG